MGRWLQRNDNGQRTVYLGKLYQRNLSTGIQTKHYALNGKLVAVNGGGGVSFLLTDHPSTGSGQVWAALTSFSMPTAASVPGCAMTPFDRLRAGLGQAALRPEHHPHRLPLHGAAL